MASLNSSFPHLRRITLHSLLAVLAIAFLGMARKDPGIMVRFYAEANEHDTDRFAKPIIFRHPERKGFIESVPTIHEGVIKAVYPFPAKDGTMGCTFLLDTKGRMDLEVISTSRRGTVLVGIISTKVAKMPHQVVELMIDKPVTDGIISIPNGLTEMEIDAITKSWPVIGQTKKKK